MSSLIQTDFNSEYKNILSKLDQQKNNIVLTIRNDEFTKKNEKFDQFSKMLRSDLNLILAVIPGKLSITSEDAESLCKSYQIAMHGFMHFNHSTIPNKSEYSLDRSFENVLVELWLSKRVLTDFFPIDKSIPFVPPWNMFGEKFIPALQEIGLKELHGAGPDCFTQYGMAYYPYHFNFTNIYNKVGGVLNDLIKSYIVTINKNFDAISRSPYGCIINTHHLMMDQDQRQKFKALTDFSKNYFGI